MQEGSVYRPIQTPGEVVPQGQVDELYTDEELATFGTEAALDEVRDTGDVEILGSSDPSEVTDQEFMHRLRENRERTVQKRARSIEYRSTPDLKGLANIIRAKRSRV